MFRDYFAIATAIFDQTVENGGGTFYPDDGTPHSHNEGFFVGIGSEPDGEWSADVIPTNQGLDNPATRERCIRSIAALCARIVRYGDDDIFLGTWVQGGRLPAIHIECSRWFANERDAVEVAAYRGEIAIWDVANEDEIELQYA